MPVEKSAGAIIIRRPRSRTSGSLRRKDSNEIYYLLLHYPSSSKAKNPHSRASSLRGRDYWDLPKGHIEKGEDILSTVRREVLEETGLGDINLVEGFKETIRYFFRFEGKNVLKFVTFFLAETKKEKIEISPEHIGYKWLPYLEALQQLTFRNAKEILEKANRYLRTPTPNEL